MIQRQLKLKLRPSQERQLERWLWHLTGVYNWTLRTIELSADQGIYLSEYDIQARLKGHCVKLGIPVSVLHGAVYTATNAWIRFFRRLAKRPRMKGKRNRLSSMALKDIRGVALTESKIRIDSRFGWVRFHQQELPAGPIKGLRIVRRASGWYACLTINASPNAIPVVAHREVGIDPGFASLLTLSSGEKVDHPRELQRTAVRLAQAQRGRRRRLTTRLLERQRWQRRDRNHKLARRLVSEHALIAWSDDNYRGLSRSFGKSVASAALGDLRRLLADKCRTGGRVFVEVPSRLSTKTCSACGALTGPTGYAGLSVRQWVCSRCGCEHDRDVNAAVNTLIAGRGIRLERAVVRPLPELPYEARRQNSARGASAPDPPRSFLSEAP